MGNWSDQDIDLYAEEFGDDPTNVWLVNAAELAGDEAALDVGCGTGSALRHALKQGHRGRLVGVDAHARMIHHARKKSVGQSVELSVASAEKLPFDAETFDAVLAINAIHHWSDIGAGLAEVSRVLKSGGWLTFGGERFDRDTLPEGQDYTDELAAQGLTLTALQELAEGVAFAARARKGAHV